MHTEARYLVRGKILFDGRLGLVLGLRCPLENGNFKKICQYFLSKLSFDKLSWVFAFCLGIFFGFLSKWVFRAQVWVIMEWETNITFDSGFERKWNIGVKKWKPMFRKFLRGFGLMVPPWGRWRVTRISRGEKLKILKWVFDHVFSRS